MKNEKQLSKLTKMKWGFLLWAIVGILVGWASPALASDPDLLAILDQKPPAPPISSEFPFESKFVEVKGSQIHYVEVGQGDPILFIHGNPTSSYLWRNIMPHLEKQGRAIALDLIGFGQSEKPDIDYRYVSHIQYLEGFIEALDLKNVTLVIHDWGSALGLDYASRHESNVKGIAMMEALIAPAWSYDDFGPFKPLFQAMRDPITGPDLLIKQNLFVEKMIPASVIRPLGKAEMANYRAPFLKESSRKPLLVWPNQIPIAGVPQDTTQVVQSYGQWLMGSTLPKLHVYVSPGTLNPPQMVDFLQSQLKNYETAYVGHGLHFLQEDHPEAIGRAISDWYRRLNQ